MVNGMTWQDIVFTSSALLMSLSLIPTVAKVFRRVQVNISPWTSLPTSILLVAIACAYYSYHLYLSTGSTLAVSLIWLILFLGRKK